jgi:glutamate racemase
VVLPALRERFQMPFVGTVPAIKPACAMSKTRRVSVLGTRGTVEREYTQALIRDFADGCDVTLAGSDVLADLAEASLRGEPVADALILKEIEPCFVEAQGRCTDVVVLACTHYPLLIERLRALQPWPVEWLDPAPAIARRVAGLLGPPPKAATWATPPRIVFTSGVIPSPDLARVLHGFGFEAFAGT